MFYIKLAEKNIFMFQKYKNTRDNRLVCNDRLILKVSLIQNIGDESMENVKEKTKKAYINDILKKSKTMKAEKIKLLITKAENLKNQHI